MRCNAAWCRPKGNELTNSNAAYFGQPPQAAPRILVLGASAGGVEALVRVCRGFSADLNAAICIVLHIPAQGPSMMPQILSRNSALSAKHPVDGEPIQQGQIYIAPPDHHLILEPGRLRVLRGPKENRQRPAVDVLFRSAALAYGAQVIGVVLTGALDDGTAGLLAIKQRSGIAIVQDPNEALFAGMPRSALQNVAVDYVTLLAEIPKVLSRLVSELVLHEAPPPSSQLISEVKIAMMDQQALDQEQTIGKPSAYSCPECGGVLWEVQDDDLLRFRCRVGHAFSSQSVLAQQATSLETALWAALKTLEENVSLSRRLSNQSRERGNTSLTAVFDERVRESEIRADAIRKVLLKNEPDIAPL